MSNQSALAKQCIANMLAAIELAEEELGRLDAFAGDGDHGAGMVRGLRAANQAAQAVQSEFARDVIAAAGSAFIDTAGGASGVLFGTLIATAGQMLSDEPDSTNVYQAVQAGVDAVCELGKTKAGDKTMIDTLLPFVKTLGEASQQGTTVIDAWLQALPSAKSGMESTTDMVSKRGRSSRLGDRSKGSMDPGSVSVYYLLQAVAETLKS